MESSTESWTTSNLGVSGSTVAHWAGFVDSQLSTVASNNGTQFALVNLGANEILTVLPSEATWRANFGIVLDAIHAKYPDALVYSMRPWAIGHDAASATVKGWIEAEEAERPGWALPGPDEAVWAKAGDNGATNYTDGVHYSVAGNASCVTAWRAVLGY